MYGFCIVIICIRNLLGIQSTKLGEQKSKSRQVKKIKNQKKKNTQGYGGVGHAFKQVIKRLEKGIKVLNHAQITHDTWFVGDGVLKEKTVWTLEKWFYLALATS